MFRLSDCCLTWVTQNLLGFFYCNIWHPQLHRIVYGLFVARAACWLVILHEKLLSKVLRAGVGSSLLIKIKNWHLHSVTVLTQMHLASREKTGSFFIFSCFMISWDNWPHTLIQSKAGQILPRREGTSSHPLEIRPKAVTWVFLLKKL